MRKYLEKVKELSDVTKLKACLKPYVCATEDGQIEYTPSSNGLEILTHESEKERILDAGTWEFYIPSVYFQEYSDEWYDTETPIFTVRPLSGSGTAECTYDMSPYNIFGLSTWTARFNSETVDGNQILKHNTNESRMWWLFGAPFAFLVKVSISISQPSVVTINLNNLVFDNIIKCIPEQIGIGESVTIDGEKEIRLNLLKMAELKSCYLRWDGADTLYLATSGFLTDPAYANGNVVEIPPQGFISVPNNDLAAPPCTKTIATSASVGRLTIVEFLTNPQNNAILLETAENFTVDDNSPIYCIGIKRTEGLALKFITSERVNSMLMSSSADFEESNTKIVYPEVINGETGFFLSRLERPSYEDDDEYFYIKFNADSAFDVYFDEWDAGNMAQTRRLVPNSTISIVGSSSAPTYSYRITYADWKSDITLAWLGGQACYVYLGTSPTFTASQSNSQVVLYKPMPKLSTITITKDEMLALEDMVGTQGYLYFKFTSRRNGNLTISTE